MCYPLVGLAATLFWLCWLWYFVCIPSTFVATIAANPSHLKICESSEDSSCLGRYILRSIIALDRLFPLVPRH